MMVKYVAVSAIVFVVNLLAFTSACPSMGIGKLQHIFSRIKEPVVKPLSEITLEKNVWKVAPLKHGKENPASKVTLATTVEGYTLSCVPTEEGRQQCAELAKLEGKDSLHYVELIFAGGSLLESFCTSDIKDIPNHIQHMCDYHFCTPNSCTSLFVFDMKVALESTDDHMCRTVAISVEDEGPKVKKSSFCDTVSQIPGKDSVLQDCKSHRGRVSSPSQKRWKMEKNPQCTVIKNK